MTFTHALATNNYGPAKFIVDGTTVANGTHSTIAAALTSASSGDTIFIRPGTYTENLTLKAGVNLTAYDTTGQIASASTGNVIISGKATFTAAGTVSLFGICLQTNSDFCLAVTGSAASVINLKHCYLNCTNNTGISLTSTSASSIINLSYCSGDLTTTGIALFAHSGAGSIYLDYCSFNNSGGSSTANALTGTGHITTNWTDFENPLSLASSSSLNSVSCSFHMNGNFTALTLSDTSSGSISTATIVSGTATAITVNTGTTLQLHSCLIASSNGTTISGSGTLQFTEITFNSVAVLANTLTISNGAMNTFLGAGGPGTSGQVLTSNGSFSPPTYQTVSSGSLVLLQTQSASSSASIAFNSTYITNTYNDYLLVYNNVTAQTNAVTFQIQFSSNNGSTYISTGYSSSANTSTATSTSAVLLSNGALFANTGIGSGSYYLCNMTSGGTPNGTGTCTYPASNAGSLAIAGANGFYGPTSTTVNNIKIFFSSGNIVTGNFSLYGIIS